MRVIEVIVVFDEEEFTISCLLLVNPLTSPQSRKYLVEIDRLKSKSDCIIPYTLIPNFLSRLAILYQNKLV